MSKTSRRTMKSSMKMEDETLFNVFSVTSALPVATAAAGPSAAAAGPSAVVADPSAAVGPLTVRSPTKFDVSFHPGRRLSVTMFRGSLYVHIREYNELNGKFYPTKKGVSFTPGRFRMLRSIIEKIDNVLRQQEANASYAVDLGGGTLLKEHVGAGIYVSVDDKFHGVSLRRHWMPPDGQGKIVPTKNGIFVPASQWESLKAKMDELLESCPEVIAEEPCSFTHQNQMGMLECNECMPFGWLSI